MRRLFIVFALIFAATAAAADYRVRSGDILIIEVLEDGDLNRTTLVLPDGTIGFPLAGSVRARGRTTSQISAGLATALEPNFASRPTVFVTVDTLAEIDDSPRTIDAFVIGEVNEPGRKEVKRGTTLLQLVAEAGSFTRFAATKRLILRRVDPRTSEEFVYKFNYRAVEKGASIGGSTVLRDGDVLIVPERRLFE